jgi:S-adenosylmethionine synthetase
MKNDFVFTSESVTEGHPDKLCDQISDAIVDHFLRQDPQARVIAECAASTAILFIAARFDARASVDFPAIARLVIDRIGYDQPGFNSRSSSVVTSLKELPAEQDGRFDESCLSEDQIDRIPVRNQVTVFGFACNQTPVLMPLPIWLAHRLARQLTMVRRSKQLSYLAPDGKTQVGIEYHQRRASRIHSITVIASQDAPATSGGPDLEQLQDDLRATVVDPVFQDEALKPDNATEIFINPDGPFIQGGPAVHAGLTGRKNAIDTYGEYARHSGAALSGKDPTRIDRIGAYVARYAAKNVVAAGLAEECEVQLSYSIGQARPVSIQVETFGTGVIADDAICELVARHCDFRLAGIMRQFRLRSLPAQIEGGFYEQLAAYGHLGREDLLVPWEATDKADALRSDAGIRSATSPT